MEKKAKKACLKVICVCTPLCRKWIVYLFKVNHDSKAYDVLIRCCCSVVVFYTTAKTHQSVNKNLLPFCYIYCHCCCRCCYISAVTCILFEFHIEWLASNQSDSCRMTNLHDEAPRSRDCCYFQCDLKTLSFSDFVAAAVVIISFTISTDHKCYWIWLFLRLRKERDNAEKAEHLAYKTKSSRFYQNAKRDTVAHTQINYYNSNLDLVFQTHTHKNRTICILNLLFFLRCCFCCSFFNWRTKKKNERNGVVNSGIKMYNSYILKTKEKNDDINDKNQKH